MKSKNKRGGSRARHGMYTNATMWGVAGGTVPPPNFQLLATPNVTASLTLVKYSPLSSQPTQEIGGGTATTGLEISGGRLQVNVFPAFSTGANITSTCNVNVALYKTTWDANFPLGGAWAFKNILDPGEVSTRDFYYLESRAVDFAYSMAGGAAFLLKDPASRFHIRVPRVSVESGEALVLAVAFGFVTTAPTFQLGVGVNGRLTTLHFD